MDCIVSSCASRRYTTKSHRFPRNFSVGQAWLKAINNPILRRYTYDEILKKQFRICYKHFSPDSWLPHLKRPRLKDDAVPNLFLGNSVKGEFFIEQSIDAVNITSQENCVPNPLSMEVFPSLKYERSPCTSPVRESSLTTSLELPKKRQKSCNELKIREDLFPDLEVSAESLTVISEEIVNSEGNSFEQTRVIEEHEINEYEIEIIEINDEIDEVGGEIKKEIEEEIKEEIIGC